MYIRFNNDQAGYTGFDGLHSLWPLLSRLSRYSP